MTKTTLTKTTLIKPTLAIAAAAVIATSSLAAARPVHSTRAEQTQEVHAKAHASLRNSYNYAPVSSDSLAGEEFYGVNAYHHPGSNDWDAYQQDD